MTYKEAEKELDDAGKALDEARYRLQEAILPYQPGSLWTASGLGGRLLPPQRWIALPIVEGSEEDLRLEGLRDDVNNAVKRYSDARARIAEQTSVWWRRLTGVLGLSLLVGGALPVVVLVILFRGACDDPEHFCGEAILVAGVFLIVTTPLMVAGGLFAWATFTPFGWGRRVMIGLGASISAGLATFFLSVVVLDASWGSDPRLVMASVIAGAAAAAFFYLSYRVAR